MTQGTPEHGNNPAAEVLADLLAVAEGAASEGAAPDDTIVVNQHDAGSGGPNHAGRADDVVDRTVVVDHTVVVARPVEETSDHTVVSGASGASLDDFTVVAARAEPEVDEHTIAVNQREVDDLTIVANQPTLAEDGTVVVAAAADGDSGSDGGGDSRPRDQESARGSKSGQAQSAAESRAATPAATSGQRGLLKRIVGGGLDVNRPIAQAPGSLPWEQQPTGVRGVSQGLPVSYGARVQTETPLETGVDEVQRRVGPAPEPRQVAVLQDREALPSLRRRDQKRTLVTLLMYAGVTLACVFGLWGLAAIAFGW